MRAILVVSTDGRRTLEARDVPDPGPGPTDLLVRVRAAGLNRADLARNAYHYGHSDRSAPPIAGLEMAGEVIALGRDVRRFRPGDRVMAMASGCYAELAKVDERLAMPVPPGMSWEEAGATPVAFLTAHDALAMQARLATGEAVLVHAATSGVGVAAVQLAKLRAARLVLGTSGSREKLGVVAKLGVDVGIDYREESVADRVLAATDRRGVDVVVDIVGGSVLSENVRCMAVGARLVQIGRLGGGTAELDLDELARKRLTLTGVTFRTRSLDDHAAIVAGFVEEAWAGFGDGRLRTLIDRAFPLAEAVAAQDYLRTSAHVGKIVLRVA